MEFQEQISEAQQINWFKQIEKSKTDFYYIIYLKETPIGLIHLNQIDKISKTGHAGLFIGEPNFIGTGAVLGASLLILDFAFNTLDLSTIFAKVKKSNFAAIEYNQLLGFEWIANLNADFDLFRLDQVRFKQKHKLLEKLIAL